MLAVDRADRANIILSQKRRSFEIFSRSTSHVNKFENFVCSLTRSEDDFSFKIRDTCNCSKALSAITKQRL